jgi:WD40 repeat protein
LRDRPIISPSGDQLATVQSDARAIKLWDVKSGAAIRSLGGHEGPVEALAYSPDGKRLASGSADKTVRLRDVAAGRDLAVLRGHVKAVFNRSPAPDQ